MSSKCARCFRRVKTCYCKAIDPIDPGVKFVVLMHPKEAFKQKTGTGRLTHLNLVDSEVVVDTTFDHNARTQALLNDPEYYPVVLYPDEAAQDTETFPFASVLHRKKLLIFLIDATWTFAYKMITRSASLQALPHLSFREAYRSRFEIKKQPAATYLSTIESAYYLIKELQTAGVCAQNLNPEGLMDVFELLITRQKHFIAASSTSPLV